MNGPVRAALPVPADAVSMELLASAIHDTKCTLALLQARFDALQSFLGDDPHARSTLVAMQEHVEHINQHLVRLLTFYKLQRGLYSLNVDLYAAAELLEEVLATQRVALEARGLVPTIDCDARLEGYFDFNLVAGVLAYALRDLGVRARSRLLLRAWTSAERSLVLAVEADAPAYGDAAIALASGTQDADGLPLADADELGLRLARLAAEAHGNRGRRGHLRLVNDGETRAVRLELHLV